MKPPTMRLLKRVTLIVATAVFTMTLFLIFDSFTSGFGSSGSQITHVEANPQEQKIPACTAPRTETWEALKAGRESLLDDKFTIAISTFHRPKELNHVLNGLLSSYIPSLLDIVVIWKNFDEPTPESFVSEHGVHVRYRKPPQNSLNDKLYPDPEYRTQAVLLSDDDVYYRPSDLEFVFQTWRKYGQGRITGALSRCALPDGDGLWKYSKCGWFSGEYSLVLTNLAFAHVGFMDFYNSNDTAMVAIRDHIDANMNCEDIAMNFVASYLTGSGPLLVRGHDQYVNLDPSTGISQGSGHINTRSECINSFAALFECMPLVMEEGRIERGYKHNLWYKSMWDRIVY